MENLPKNVINKIMFYLSHPTAELIEGTSIFEFMALRTNKERTYPGSPHYCGLVDYMCRHLIYNPRKFGTTNLTDEERGDYQVTYLHCCSQHIEHQRDLIIRWSIRDNKIRWEEYHSDSDNYNNSDTSETDSD